MRDGVFIGIFFSIVALSSCLDDSHAMARVASHHSSSHHSSRVGVSHAYTKIKPLPMIPKEYQSRFGVIPQFPLIHVRDCEAKGSETNCKSEFK